MTAEELFQQERRTGVGASDVQAVLNLEPWGCQRRLWYQKRDVQPDYETGENKLFARGHALEPIIADMYAEATGREVTPMPLWRHKNHPELMVHADRGISIPGPKLNYPGTVDYSKSGILEIKTVNSQMFSKVKREGLPPAYTVQLQHAMLVTGAEWGAFAVLWADGWELRYWDVVADADLQKIILDACLKFWVLVQNGPAPEPLPPTDPRCQKCPWRTQCQGEALSKLAGVPSGFDASLRQLTEDYLAARELAEQADAVKEAAGDRLREAMGDRVSVETIGARILYRPVTSNRWDTKALDKYHPELAAQFKKPSQSRPLKVYAI